MTGRALSSQVSGGAFKQAPVPGEGERPSAFLVKCLARCGLPGDATAVDLACGRGRHLVHLASACSRVIGLDIDAAALHVSSARVPRALVLQADLQRGIPLASSSVALVAAIHGPMLDLISEFARVLAPGGRLIFETFGGRGENWRNLPGSRDVARAAGAHFDLISYREAAVGPHGAGKVSAKMFAQRR